MPPLDVEVMGNAVALTRRAVAVEPNRALAVEMHRRLVAVQILEHRRQRLSAVQLLARLGPGTIHVDDEAGFLGEEALLTLAVAAVGTVRIGVEELTDGEAVGLRGGRDVSVDDRSLLWIRF